MLISIVVIAIGGSLGCLLRWYFALRLNGQFPNLPPGTLTANLVGGYLIGVAMAVFIAYPELSPQLKLLIVTGFLGGLTTFSSFSAEVVTALLSGRAMWAVATIAVHVVGSITIRAPAPSPERSDQRACYWSAHRRKPCRSAVVR